MIKIILLLMATVMVMTVGIGTGTVSVYGQVPEHCGYSQEHACAVPDEEDAEKILEVFPDAIVIVDEELYESIPEEDREDAEGIIESGARGEGDEEDSGESGAGLNDACLQSGFSQAQCSNMLFSDDPGGYCSTLKLAGLDCPKIQDPRFTYGNPEEARGQSEQQIENTERAIQGFEQAVPDNLGRGFVIK